MEVEVTYKELETAPEAPPLGPRPGVHGLVVRSPSALPSVVGVAQIVAANVIDEADVFEAIGGRLTRERSLTFDPFPQGGREVYRLYILENPWEARGHAGWSPPTHSIESEDPAEIAMAMAAWAAPAAELFVTDPTRTAMRIS